MPNLPIKFHQNPLSGLGGTLTCKTFKLNYFPLEASNSNYTPFYTSSYDAQPSYEVSSKSLEWFKKNYTYKVLTCKTLNLDYLHLESFNITYILSCASTYIA